jgi:arsenate reductase (thioredoxin)
MKPRNEAGFLFELIRTIMEKKKVIFICTHNSIRSQMAQAILNYFCGDRYEAFSAGSDPAGVNPITVSVLQEIGIDSSGHYSKGLDLYGNDKFDYVVTVCDRAKESCPYFPNGVKKLHKSFSDPSLLPGSPESIVAEFRKSRDEIRNWIEKEFE